MIKSLDPLGFEQGQTSSSAELHVPFWNSWTKDKIPTVQEGFLFSYILLKLQWDKQCEIYLQTSRQNQDIGMMEAEIKILYK